MRLINCSTRKLEEHVGESIPRYAILSHTWGPDEVAYQDLASREPREYAGNHSWWKLERSCQQALEDGWDYLWADTVCIDKSSSAELSEAINSMFKWYRNAEVCYAFLSDLDDPEGNAEGLENCRWFTRGWTLQEMIAAESVNFYDKNWTSQGSKATLLDRICSITGVDTKALRGGNLRFFSVARKMSWASNRKTTRKEDMAYCLLGIFDISMPLLYGEGSKAFIRLQEEIVKSYDDESLFAWASKCGIIETSGLLAPSPAAFASSGDIAPCLTPDGAHGMSGPITITSRGVSLKVPIEEYTSSEGRSLYLFRLNCKRVTFDRESGIRMGIIVSPVSKIQGYDSDISRYTRVYPDRLESFQPKADASPRRIYLLKENRLPEFDLWSYDVFLIRTMPEWPSGCEFQLLRALPPDCWDSRNEIFKRRTSEHVAEKPPFVLIFRRGDPASGSAGYFIVAMGRTISPSHVQNGFDGGSFWCNARYCQTDGDLNIERELSILNEDQSQKTVFAEGAGVTLKCLVRPEVMSEQHLFFVDLLVKASVYSQMV
ncbi:hypothetical protein diail_10459 [Diaporthe ilicicola]|nr:hypothetical protein diail_10459 [Diaporthe ilicicola]